MVPPTSYLLCATPRSGSTLLCGLLASTDVAGHPESYFRDADKAQWAERWGIGLDPDESFPSDAYVRAALAAGRTDNGVFGARVMWDSFSALVEQDPHGMGRSRLDECFGPIRFVHLRRRDAVAQAVSRLKAEQTGRWHEPIDEPIGSPDGSSSTFDFPRLRAFVDEVERDNASWDRWFADHAISPHRLWYEDLAAEPVVATTGVLAYLGLSLPPGRTIAVRHRRLADASSADWVRRYRDCLGDEDSPTAHTP